MPDLMADMYSQRATNCVPGQTQPGFRHQPLLAPCAALPPNQRTERASQHCQTEFNAEFEPLLDDLLTIPVLKTLTGRWKRSNKSWITTCRDSGVRGALGGAGDWLFKSADIHNVALMEDRATLRISSQHSPTGYVTVF